ncbi:cobyric acid synthase [bacterium BMS3Bbin05]|nr:cobyric acid synthase [bacterium BMS3Bbin05]
MIQGTGSGAGKSLMVTALCRIFSDMGVDVAPFKSQNMALNSYITIEGGEIGRAQALQAEAARLEAVNDMNPILLKVSGEKGSQVIIHGRPHSHMKAVEYYAFKETAWKAVRESYDRLASGHDLIVIEGAGSPAEINLTDVEIVNMSVAKYAGAPVILVGDIDRGGVFASLFGTVKLLGRESRFIKGYIVNKFRGDISILEPGLEMIREKTGRPVIGVLPYIPETGLPEEDGMVLQQRPVAGNRKSEYGTIKVVIVRLKYISNFTDYDPLACEPDVELLYSINPVEIENADFVIIPGSKNTMEDLNFLRELSLDESVRRAHAKGIPVMGMCGGYQILGKKIYDPQYVEGGYVEVDGIGLLDIETVFNETKTTCRVEAEVVQGGMFGDFSLPLKGYEIHMGESRGAVGLFRMQRLNGFARSTGPDALNLETMDGSMNGNCWGTYIHGIFENDAFRRKILNSIRAGRGLPAIGVLRSYSEIKDNAIDNLARIVKKNIDMDYLRRLVKI